MCGISGIIGIDQRRTVSIERLRAMNDSLVHRGPDDSGTYVRGSEGLAHRRLSIIDLDSGAQPMSVCDDQYTIVFNGEIYNYRELRADLERHGHHFKTNSDTEVILRAYVEHGSGCVQLLRGMFTFALHDRQRDRVFVARDRLGIKPLYYAIEDGCLLFGSEQKALRAVQVQRGEIDEASVDFFISVGYVPDGRTLFKNIWRLPAGHTITVSDNRMEIEKYWDLSLPGTGQGAAMSEPRILREFESRLKESINAHLVSDVPLGAFLSGGLDSSAIVSLMAASGCQNIKTFSLGYSNSPNSSELEYARTVADHLNTEHHEVILTPGDFFGSIDSVLEHAELPIFDSSAVALGELARFAREHVKVVLSGEGSDEVLAGYPVYRIMANVDRAYGVSRFIPASLRSCIADAVRRNEKLAKYWDWCTTHANARYQSVSSDLTENTKRQLYSEEFANRAGATVADYFSALYNTFPNGTKLQRMTYVDLKSWLVGVSLLKSDKMSMASSLEVRVPFLDHEFVEFGCGLPDNYRIRGGHDKYLLKRVMEKFLPRQIIYRKKQGFPVPIARWFREGLFDKLCEVLTDPATTNRGYFNSGYITQLLRDHSDGRYDNSRRLYSLLILELWHRKFA